MYKIQTNMSNSLYKTPQAQKESMRLYEAKLQSLKISYTEKDVETTFGQTHIIVAGDSTKPPVLVLHGIHAGAPVSVEAIQGLGEQYCILAIDTIGQTTKSAQTQLPINNNAYGQWLAEVMDALQIEQAPIVGVSYGAFILQRLISYAPHRISKCIFVVPSGLVNGPFWASMKKLTLPLLKYKIWKKEKHLRQFMQAFYTQISKEDVAFQKNLLTGVNLDFRRPKLLQAEEAQQLEAPLYVIIAEKDYFFPGPKALERCHKLFKKVKDSYQLKGSKHIPSAQAFDKITSLIRKWLAEE